MLHYFSKHCFVNIWLNTVQLISIYPGGPLVCVLSGDQINTGGNLVDL